MSVATLVSFGGKPEGSSSPCRNSYCLDKTNNNYPVFQAQARNEEYIRDNTSFSNNLQLLCQRYPEVNNQLIASFLESSLNDIKKASSLLQQMNKLPVSTGMSRSKRREREWMDDDLCQASKYRKHFHLNCGTSNGQDFSQDINDLQEQQEPQEHCVDTATLSSVLSSYLSDTETCTSELCSPTIAPIERLFSSVQSSSALSEPIPSPLASSSSSSLSSSSAQETAAGVSSSSSSSALTSVSSSASTPASSSSLSSSFTSAVTSAACNNFTANNIAVNSSNNIINIVKSNSSLNNAVVINNQQRTNNSLLQTLDAGQITKLLSRMVIFQYDKITALQRQRDHLEDENQTLKAQLDNVREQLQRYKHANSSLQYYVAASNQIAPADNSLYLGGFNRHVF